MYIVKSIKCYEVHVLASLSRVASELSWEHVHVADLNFEISINFPYQLSFIWFQLHFF